MPGPTATQVMGLLLTSFYWQDEHSLLQMVRPQTINMRMTFTVNPLGGVRICVRSSSLSHSYNNLKDPLQSIILASCNRCVIQCLQRPLQLNAKVLVNWDSTRNRWPNIHELLLGPLATWSPCPHIPNYLTLNRAKRLHWGSKTPASIHLCANLAPSSSTQYPGQW